MLMQGRWSTHPVELMLKPWLAEEDAHPAMAHYTVLPHQACCRVNHYASQESDTNSELEGPPDAW